jgi:hypothetical protein
MIPSLFLASALIVAPTQTSPVEVLGICRFNAALADDELLNHLVDLTGTVSEIERDGIGGYIVLLEGKSHLGEFAGRVEIRCYFSASARSGLAKIKPGEAVTIRGVPRELRDHLHFPVDRTVSIKMKDCQLLEAAE